MNYINIGNFEVGPEKPCLVIAEAGVNHNGDVEMAKKLIEAAKRAGADMVKFQTFTTEDVMTKTVAQAAYQTENTGKSETMFEMCKRLELSPDDFVALKKHCDDFGIAFLSTPHSPDAIDSLEPLVEAYKVGSGDLTNIPFLKKIALKGKPMIVSTGMATLDEVREAVEAILPINTQLILLHCTTNYPTLPKDVNLQAMLTLEREFGLLVGYSDHTENIGVSLAAVALGARVVEKHFTLDKTLPGPDHKASLEPQELKTLVDGIREVEKRVAGGEEPKKIITELGVEEALGDGVKKPTASELEVAKVARKSIVAAVDIAQGTRVEEGMLAVKRPGTGIKPGRIGEIVGKTAAAVIAKDEVVSFEKLQD